jgi:hypothetical protein
MKLGTSVDGHAKIIIWKFHWNRPRNKRYRAIPILSKICISANVHVGKLFTLKVQTFYSKLEISHCQKKLDLRKKQLFSDRPSSFCSTYPNICDRTKRMDYSYMYIFRS